MLALIGFPAFIGDWIFFHSCHTMKSKQSVRSSTGVILTARFACCLMAGNSILYKLPEAFRHLVILKDNYRDFLTHLSILSLSDIH